MGAAESENDDRAPFKDAAAGQERSVAGRARIRRLQRPYRNERLSGQRHRLLRPHGERQPSPAPPYHGAAPAQTAGRYARQLFVRCFGRRGTVCAERPCAARKSGVGVPSRQIDPANTNARSAGQPHADALRRRTGACRNGGGHGKNGRLSGGLCAVFHGGPACRKVRKRQDLLRRCCGGIGQRFAEPCL